MWNTANACKGIRGVDMWKGDKSASQQRRKELFSHKHVTSHAGMAIPLLFNPQKRARESTAFLYTSTPPFALRRHRAHSPMTKNASNMSDWITITDRRKRVSPTKKKIPASNSRQHPNFTQKSWAISQGGADFWSCSAQMIFLKLMLICSIMLLKRFFNYYYFSHKLWWTWRSEESLIWNVTWGYRSLQVIQASCILSFLLPVLEE